MKTCAACKKEKSLSKFSRFRNGTAGRQAYCVECAREKRIIMDQHNRNIGPKVFNTEKKCCDCKRIKKIEQFSKSAVRVDGHHTVCKDCSKKRNKINRSRGVTIHRTEKICRVCRNKKQISQFYKHAGRPDGHRNECKECQRNDIRHQLSKSIYTAIEQYLPGGKTGAAIDYGIDIKEIIEAIGPRPKTGRYHLDHVIPLVAFDYSDSVQIAASWHPKNLQWLTRKQNLKKGATYTTTDLQKYIEWFKTTVQNVHP